MTTVIELEELQNNSTLIYDHFMHYGDEVFYVLKKGRMYGIVTPGDLYRNYIQKTPLINKRFAYIDSVDDKVQAEEIFQKHPTIHEIAVVEKGRFLGVLKSGNRKTPSEWEAIRNAFRGGKLTWDEEFVCRLEIYKLLELKCPIYIYPYLGMKKGCELLSEEGAEAFAERMSYMSEGKAINTMTQKEAKDFFGEYSWKYHRNLYDLWNLLKVDYKNGIPRYRECLDNEMYTIDEHGYRNVPSSIPLNVKRRIFTVGPCTMFGAYTANEETIQAYLQELLIKNGITNCEVVNLSVAMEMSIARLFNEKISENDIVIIMTNKFQLWKSLESEYRDKFTCVDNLNCIWDKIENPYSCLYNSYEHCNWKVNREIASKIYHDIKVSLEREIKDVQAECLQDYYILPDIAAYYREHFLSYVGHRQVGKKGAIVMNCNPFTKGHRYLIEKAANQVDFLYIFVVQEDKSVFSFEDRYQMVKNGTKDIENVCVLPSGDYIISQKTFEQYFTKDQVDVIDDMDYDVHIFGEIVAKEFDISIRFVGEEPYDKVTNKYNEAMKRILPEHGVEVREIPRVANDKGEVISASKVRKYMAENNVEALRSMLPESTYRYLMREKE